MPEAMKESGIEWVGQVPILWKSKRAKYIFSNHKYIPGVQSYKYNRLALTLNGVIQRSKDDSDGLQPTDFNTYQLLRENELVFKLIDLQNISTSRVGLAHTTGLVSPAYIVLQAKGEILPEFAEKYYLMMWHRQIFNALGDSGVRSSLNASELLELPIIIPPIEEQKKIASFLDEKCNEIDSLTNDIQTQITTLEKYKKSLITETVTKGLNPSIKTKSTDNKYWENIPVNWELSDIKYLFEIVKRIAGKEGYDILSVTQKGLKIKDISKNEGQIAESYANYQFVYPTDFVMNHMDLLTGWVDCSKYFGVTSPDYRVFRLRDKKNNLNYYKYVMQSCYMNKIFYSLGQGVSNLGRWRLQTSTFNNFKIPDPPLDEQQQIADYLDSKCSEIDAIIQTKKEQLDVLAEYKKSLIYEYVTGKREVK